MQIMRIDRAQVQDGDFGWLSCLVCALSMQNLDAVLPERPVPGNVTTRVLKHLQGHNRLSRFGKPETPAHAHLRNHPG